jgi:hypothetical protein
MRGLTQLIKIEKKIAELVQSGLSQHKILTSIGLVRLTDLHWLDNEDLEYCLNVLSHIQEDSAA